MADLDHGDRGGRLLYAILTLCLVQNITLAICNALVALSEKADAAQAAAGLLPMIFVLFSAFLKNGNALQSYIVWVYWRNPAYYALEALFIDEFENLNFAGVEDELVPRNPGIPVVLRVCGIGSEANCLRNALGIY